MSTFGGFMPEFPHIRIDFFRHIEGVPPPLACFLSHVHSDHLAGLESLKSPFIYCSAATKALLLRLERYPHRINFEKGILESRKQHYKHLKNLLKPIPLHTPTCIELAPGNVIQVTLFDANHCTGAVMFLIEGNGRAVLYTGDVRAEPWFVNALARNPCIIEYTSGLKKLDCIYLDTSFTEDVFFPTKAEGLAELLQKISKYPPTTEFHFAAWTFGYEEVWMALSRSLKSQIHVDGYKMRLYDSLRDDGAQVHGSYLTPEAPILTGHMVGNTEYPGILTRDHTVRLHSCEKGIRCSHLGDQTVWIKPIIARTSSGQEICEIGIGGGGGDLNQRPEVELDSDAVIMQLMELFVNQGDSSVLSDIRRMLLAGLHSSRKALVLNEALPDCEQDNLTLEELANILARSAAQPPPPGDVTPAREADVLLPKIITFPYSRHSSYAELRDLVRLFKPVDIYPCTVNKADWHEGVSTRALFGDLCSGNIFRHDREMHESLLDPLQYQTQKLWNTYNINGSRASSEDEDYQDDVSDSKDEVPPQAQRIDAATGPIARDIEISQNVYGDDSLELRRSTQIGTMSDLFQANSSCSHGNIPQSIRSSPESETYGLRRRASLEEDNGSSRKRARVHGDHTDSKSQTPVDNAEMPDPENALQPETAGVPGVSYFDTHHGVYRCETCGWEIWRPKGTRTGCSTGESAFSEVTDSTAEEGSNEHADAQPKPRNRDHFPRIYISSNAVKDGGADDTEAKELIEVTRNYLDDASAYDSISNAADNEYEISSFIDDSPVDARNDEVTDGSASDDIDCTARYEQFSTACRNLEQEHGDLIDDHEAFRRDVLGSDYDDSNDPDEPQFDVVDIEVQDPPISEVVLSHVQGDSQSSVISTRRLMTRVDAFLAAPEEWHNISLMSTGDNHTEESQEL